jgi:hypothetical protein
VLNERNASLNHFAYSCWVTFETSDLLFDGITPGKWADID